MANVKITDLSAGTALGGTELFESVQSAASVKLTADQIKTFVGQSFVISNGVGEFDSITVTAGAIPFNAITNRAVGQFESHLDQTATSANVADVVQLDSAASFNAGITVASSANVTVAAAGIYAISSRLQFANADSTNHTSTFWFRKNGTNISNTASVISVPKVADGGKTLAQVTIYESLSISDYVQLVWSVSNTNVSLDYTTASGVIPEVPSVLFNMERVK